MTSDPALETNKQAEIASRTEEFMFAEQAKPFYHGTEPWLSWATVIEVFSDLGITPGQSVLDIGVGPGWTTLLLAESGYRVLGVDIVPANIELAQQRAAKWQNKARFAVADMDTLDLGETFQHALVVDALHHSARQRQVLEGISRHVEPGGWIVLGEPGWLHTISPSAKATAKELGWIERGITIRSLKRDLKATGFESCRRFVQPIAPTPASVRGLAWQAIRFAAGSVGLGPQMHNWVAAKKV